MRSRRFKRRLFWTGVILALTLIWLAVQVLRVAGVIRLAARRPRQAHRWDSPRQGTVPPPLSAGRVRSAA
jgi:hypothetical protein